MRNEDYLTPSPEDEQEFNRQLAEYESKLKNDGSKEERI